MFPALAKAMQKRLYKDLEKAIASVEKEDLAEYLGLQYRMALELRDQVRLTIIVS